NLRTERIFITHSGTTDDVIELVKEEIQAYASFNHIYVTRAGCTISSHCGPKTLGILFMTE
ncbi:MAG TPA: DegV family protein, partial [Pseudogracilibacillus sp.]|nr:DegV family protein [Pseudogracilibacillus sp.]